MNADSVKARLKNFAVSSGCTFQEALVYYGLERTIYRISVSQFCMPSSTENTRVPPQMLTFWPDVSRTVLKK